MQDVRDKLAREMPELTTYFQRADSWMVSSIRAARANRYSGEFNGYGRVVRTGKDARAKDQGNAECQCVYIPQIRLPRNSTEHRPGKSQPDRPLGQDVVDNVVTAMTSDGMVVPAIDRSKSGNNYMVTVQYANKFLNNMSMENFENILCEGFGHPATARCSRRMKSLTKCRQWPCRGYTP